jgi:ABC-type branched-subunit amino acid transport system substrate-binding protein
MNRDRIFGATVIVALVTTVALAVALGIDLAKKDQQALPVQAGAAAATAPANSSGAAAPADGTPADNSGSAPGSALGSGAGSGSATTPSASSGSGAAVGGSRAPSAPSSPSASSAAATKPGSSSTPASGSAGSKSPSGGGQSAAVPGAPVPAPSPGGGVSTGISASTIKVGAIFPLSGPINFSLVQQAASSYFNMINEQGGINGRKVDFVYYDDGWDQQKSIQLARRLVEQDKVFAMVGNFQFFTADGVVPYVEAQGVPLVGPDSVALRELQSNVVFPMGLSTCTDGIANGKEVIDRGFKKPAYIHVAGNSAMTRIVECEDAVLKAAGITSVSKIGTSIAEPDFTQAVLRTRSADPDVLIEEHDASAILRTWQAMQRQNYSVPMLGAYPAYDTLITDYAKNYPNQAKDFSVPTGAVPIERPNDEVRRYVGATKKFFPDAHLGYFGELAWGGAKMFTDVMRQLGGTPTRGQLIDALNGLKNYESGITKPTTFNPGPKDPNHWWFRMKLDNYTKWAPTTTDWITHPCVECEKQKWTQPAR